MGRARSGVGVAWRYGLANVARRGRDSAIQVVAFGLGITVLLLLTLVRTDLLEGWRQTLDDDAPNHFLINIQPHETESVAGIFEKNGVPRPEFMPLVRARMTTINDESVKERAYPNEDGKWLANREANLSWTAELSASNELIEGEWWPADYAGPALASIEEESATNAGLKIGDRMTFFVAGREVEAEIASTRKVNWDSFQPNFFIVLSPGALDDMPTTYISSLRIPDASTPMLVDLVRAHPSISVIDLGAILEQVRGIIEKASLAVQAVFLFTLAAGIAVLFAAVQSTIDERRFESAMLRALGRQAAHGICGRHGRVCSAWHGGGRPGVGRRIGAGLPRRRHGCSSCPTSSARQSGSRAFRRCADRLLSGYFAARGAVNARPADVLRGVSS